MKMLPVTDFFAETMGGRSSQMDTTYYQGSVFKCSCGKQHVYHRSQINILRELPKMRLVFECPDEPSFLTCVKVKGLLRFKEFESLFGTKIEEDFDAMDTLKAAVEKKTGIKIEEPDGICEKCGHSDFEYDDYFDEYSCKSCGWIAK